MNKKTSIMIIIITVLIATSLILYFTKSKEHQVVENPTNSEETVSTKNEISLEDSSVLNAKTKSPEINQVENTKERFNIAMNNARGAFSKNDYPLALSYYNEALNYNKSDIVYAGMYTIYLNQKNWQKALDSVNQAIEINPSFGDYWIWKILVMDEGLKFNFSQLKKVYEEGYSQIKMEQKINLVTKFARVASEKGEKTSAINYWQKAIEINPDSKNIYQMEIDILSK